MGAFGCILCSNGMAYLQHPEATLRNFHAWLHEGGILCFNNPLVRQLRGISLWPAWLIASLSSWGGFVSQAWCGPPVLAHDSFSIFVQVPMIPLAAIVGRLAAELFGLTVPDAAQAFGTPETIHSMCKAAGFRDVQVQSLPRAHH